MLLHGIFGVLVLAGLVSAIIWMVRFAKKEMLVKIMRWALAVGLIGMVLMAVLISFWGWGLGGGSGFHSRMMWGGDGFGVMDNKTLQQMQDVMNNQNN
ncbi:hypothetical protein CO046_03050 [Candidatus Peregrinibacteria bacterium CG_4_9_14_0_2_um_filter_53_11]|nr:MAG: hypothetical protein CO046_03050 [Candidatus Peregrinibacteria bacterium CG_4_9_14_0_2_um_filter_53_11]